MSIEVIDNHEVFLTCTVCNVDWETRDQFVADETISLVGYQTIFDNLEAGYFLFTHSCKNTFRVPIKEFADLYDGPVFSERLTGSAECPGHCLRKGELDPCLRKCECAFVRAIMQNLR